MAVKGPETSNSSWHTASYLPYAIAASAVVLVALVVLTVSSTKFVCIFEKQWQIKLQEILKYRSHSSTCTKPTVPSSA